MGHNQACQYMHGENSRRRVEREKAERIVDEIMSENITNLIKDITHSRISMNSKVNTERSIPRHIMIKVLKDKKGILKVSREKGIITHKESRYVNGSRTALVYCPYVAYFRQARTAHSKSIGAKLKSLFQIKKTFSHVGRACLLCTPWNCTQHLLTRDKTNSLARKAPKSPAALQNSDAGTPHFAAVIWLRRQLCLQLPFPGGSLPHLQGGSPVPLSLGGLPLLETTPLRQLCPNADQWNPLHEPAVLSCFLPWPALNPVTYLSS